MRSFPTYMRCCGTCTAYWQPEASDAGKTMLVPLTSSMYVRGTLDTTEQVLVDIGTGYLAEKSLEEAVEFCRRKVGMLKEKIESTQQVRPHLWLRCDLSCRRLRFEAAQCVSVTLS